MATEKQVMCLQSEMDTLKALVAILEAKMHKLEARVKDAEGRVRLCNLRIVGFPEGVEGANVKAFLEDWIRKTMVQLQRQSFAGVKRKLKELGYTYMLLFPAKMKVLHAGRSHFFQSLEAAWEWLEQNDVAGTPDFLVGESDTRPSGTAVGHIAARRSTRRRCAGQGSRVIVCSDSTLSLECQRQEREEAKLLVQTVTSEASYRSRSPCVVGRLSPELSPEGT
ncbi:hypothetical protein NDU88_004451 [Pleurodeles waltl]|uniref:Uncharacterized protein n=1 Tax=Pleurodeles waltl TaxID=8319 RepID=A0AAV7MV68_PLEWA|nr:hypothetical protein NDU88_004451 [Pleurodeles waltl]